MKLPKIQILSIKDEKKKGFKFLKGINRNPKAGHVTHITESKELFGCITRPVVVAYLSFLKVPGIYLIDGQHLYLSCIRDKHDIPYIMVEVRDLEDLIKKLAKINNTAKAWSLEDYINTWGFYKLVYRQFSKICDVYDLERIIVAELVHTGNVVARRAGGLNHISKIIKDGQLRIANKKEAISILDYINDLRKMLSGMDRTAIKTIISVLIEKIKSDGKDYNHSKYKSYLLKNKEQFTLAANDIDRIRQFLSGR